LSASSPLLLLATPFTVPLLGELGGAPRSLADLRPALGSPPETTARGYLRSLAAAAVVEKRRHRGFPGSVDYCLTPAGRDLVPVAETLAAWLAASPEGQLPLGGAAARAAIAALVEAWRTGIVRALASTPVSLAELDGAIAGLGYPALKRRLASLRRLGLARAEAGSAQRTAFAAGEWLRLAVAPLLSAARWEARWSPEPAPVAARDVEAYLLLALPLLRLPGQVSGACQLIVRMAGGTLAAVTAEVRRGVVSRVPEPTSPPAARVGGTLGDWAAAILDRDPRGLEFAGETRLAAGLVDELQRNLRPS
jgi:DNA-binding HxlR family transcriptional regulator